MASLATKYGSRRLWVVLWLLVTVVLGLTFVGMELNDFHSMLSKGGAPQVSGWLSSFYSLVPLHGLHVTLASVWLLAILGQIAVYGIDHEVKVSILRLGVLWHFLDIIWIGIFSLVYIGSLA